MKFRARFDVVVFDEDLIYEFEANSIPEADGVAWKISERPGLSEGNYDLFILINDNWINTIELEAAFDGSAELDRMSSEIEIAEQLQKIKEETARRIKNLAAPDCAEPVYWKAVEDFHMAMIKALNEIHNSSIALQITEAMGDFIDRKTKEFEDYLEAVQ